MQRVLSFVDKNIGNSDADIGQMADECAVSRSVLQRRMKQMMGVTPADFLREARLKRACQLLRSTDAIVSEVAYRCGFSDPKYFSRCFKQSVGMSPTEYRETECKA
jgi:AraC-like DNA-binding protein